MGDHIMAGNWADSWPNNPVPHGTAAESYLMAGIDVAQQAALFGSVPHWSANVYITRSGTTQIPMVVPPWVDEITPSVIAAGNGSISIGYGGSVAITIDGDAGATGIDDAAEYVGPIHRVTSPYDEAGGDNMIRWLTLTAHTDVYIYALCLRYGREDYQDI